MLVIDAVKQTQRPRRPALSCDNGRPPGSRATTCPPQLVPLSQWVRGRICNPRLDSCSIIGGVSDDTPDRLVANAEVGSQRALAFGPREGTNRGLLDGRQPTAALAITAGTCVVTPRVI